MDGNLAMASALELHPDNPEYQKKPTDRVVVYKLVHEGGFFASTRSKDVFDLLQGEIFRANPEDESEFVVKKVFMTNQEFNDLGEFDGF